MKRTKLQEPKKIKIQGKVFWKVISPLPGGGSRRKFFKEKLDADTYFDQQKVEIENYGAAGAAMDSKLRAQAITAEGILKPLGLDLVAAATHYAAYMKSQSGGIPLTRAVELFKKSRDIETEEENKDKKEHQKETKLSEYAKTYQKAVSSRLKKFLEAFPNRTTSQLTSIEIEDFLKQHQSLETRRSYRRSLRALFSFLLEEEIVDKSPVKKGPKQKITYAIEVLSPAQAAKLLNSTYVELIPPIALGLFCALRACEIERLHWSKINLAQGVVVLDEETIKKTGSRRVVPIPEACKKWLALFPEKKRRGKVQPREFRKLFDLVRVQAGFKPSYTKRNDSRLQNLLAEAKARKIKLKKWPGNCLRHSAITYGLAISGDYSKVATWAGNSPAVIKTHYDAQKFKNDAKAFYAIMPRKTPANAPFTPPRPKAKRKSPPAQIKSPKHQLIS
jgi:integrase